MRSPSSFVERFEWPKGQRFTRLLALLVARLHCDANVWARRVDLTRVVVAKELAAVGPAGDDQALPLLLQFLHERLHRHFPRPVGDLCFGEPGFSQNIEVVGLDQQVSSAAGTACVAFVFRHVRGACYHARTTCDSSLRSIPVVCAAVLTGDCLEGTEAKRRRQRTNTRLPRSFCLLRQDASSGMVATPAAWLGMR